MEAMRESWTDERLDALNAKVDDLGKRMEHGFDRVDADLRTFREETRAEFAAVRSEFGSHLKGIEDRFERRFVQVDERFAQVDTRFVQVDDRFAQIDARFVRVDERFDRVDERFDRVDERFDRVDERFDKLDERFDRMFDRLEGFQRLMLRLGGVVVAALIGLVAAQL